MGGVERDAGNGRLDLDALKLRLPSLLAVVEGRVDLKPSGARQWGCCPFHGERTASFKVEGEKWYCFGCNQGGDILDFLAVERGVSVGKVITQLAQEHGLPARRLRPMQLSRQRETAQGAFEALAVQLDAMLREYAATKSAESWWLVRETERALHRFFDQSGLLPYLAFYRRLLNAFEWDDLREQLPVEHMRAHGYRCRARKEIYSDHAGWREWLPAMHGLSAAAWGRMRVEREVEAELEARK